MTRILSFLAIVGLCACSADPGATAKPVASTASSTSGAHDIDRAAMDTSLTPGDDFFRYADGTWLKNTEIPADRASYGVFDVLGEQAEQRTRGLLEAAASGNAAIGSDERRVGDYYASFMDETSIDKRGLTPLQPALKEIAALADKRALARWIGRRRSFLAIASSLTIAPGNAEK